MRKYLAWGVGIAAIVALAVYIAFVPHGITPSPPRAAPALPAEHVPPKEATRAGALPAPVTLPAPAKQAGRVVFQGVIQSQAGTPVSGAVVYYGESEQRATSDSTGAYRLEEDGQLNYRVLNCSAAGFAHNSQAVRVTDGVSPDAEQRIDFVLQSGGRVYGEVLGPDGTAVSGARVSFLPPYGQLAEDAITFKEKEVVESTGADGRYEARLLPGNYSVYAALKDRSLLGPQGGIPDITLSTGQERKLDIRMSAPARIQGQITGANGEPLGDSVSISTQYQPELQSSRDIIDLLRSSEEQPPAVVDASGHYEQPGLRFGGRYVVQATAEGLPTYTSEPFTIAAGESPLTLDIRFATGSFIAGKVQFGDGSPAAKEHLLLLAAQASKGRTVGDTTTEETGDFIFNGVPAGEYIIVPLKNLPEVLRTSMQGTSSIHADGKQPVRDVVVTVGREAGGGGVITGHIVDAQGEAVKDITVSAVEGLALEEALSAHDGSFRIEGLSAASYQVSARGKGREASQEGVAVGSDITLVLLPRAEVSGIVLDAAGKPAARCAVHLEVRLDASGYLPGMGEVMQNRVGSAETNDAGGFEISDLGASRYVVKAISQENGSGESEPFHLADGEDKSGMTIRLKRGIGFRGTVVNIQGTLITGARVGLNIVPEKLRENPKYLNRIAAEKFEPEYSVQSSESGEFGFYNLPAGDYVLTVVAEGYATMLDPTLVLRAGPDLLGHRVVLGEGGCISGKAWNSGVSQANMTVTVQGVGTYKELQTKDGGTFELCGLPAGHYSVAALSNAQFDPSPAGSWLPTVRAVDVADGKITEVDFSPSAGSTTVQGKVLGELGFISLIALAPVGDTSFVLGVTLPMEVLLESAIEDGVGLIGGEGAFLIRDVKPGEYVATVFTLRSDYLPETGNPLTAVLRQKITVAANEPLTLQLVLPTEANTSPQ